MKKSYKLLITLVMLAVMLTVILSGCINFDFSNEDSGRITDDTNNPGGQSDVAPDIKDSQVVIEKVAPENVGGELADVVERICDSVVEIRVNTNNGTSAGSGVIIAVTANNSYILTCQHVVENFKSISSSITVTLTNGESVPARYVGGIGDKDIAVIKINRTSGITKAIYRDFEEAPLRLGEETIVIGNPLGTLGGTVTRGIVSSKAREINIEGNVMTLIQTDASINSGNSGGAMFDNQGYLIGVVNAKASGEGIEGLGFAIPIDVAIEIAETLIETSNASNNPYGGLGYIPGKFMLGILTQTQSDFTYLISEVYDYASLSGKVSKNQYIVSFNDKSFSATNTLQSYLKDVNIGDTINLGIKASKNASTTTVSAQIKQYVYGYNG